MTEIKFMQRLVWLMVLSLHLLLHETAKCAEQNRKVTPDEAEFLFDFLVGRWVLWEKHTDSAGNVIVSAFPFEIARKSPTFLLGYDEKSEAVIIWDYVEKRGVIRYGRVRLHWKGAHATDRFNVFISADRESFVFVRPGDAAVVLRFLIEGEKIRIESPVYDPFNSDSHATWWERAE